MARIRTVDWFTFETGFCGENPPMLVHFGRANKLFKDLSDQSLKWCYYDTESHILRGCLVMRLQTSTGDLFILEVQRRARRVKRGGEYRDGEEPFRGIIIKPVGVPIAAWLPKVLFAIASAPGVADSVLTDCPAQASCFKHCQSKDNQFPCQSTLINAISKVELPRQ